MDGGVLVAIAMDIGMAIIADTGMVIDMDTVMVTMQVEELGMWRVTVRDHTRQCKVIFIETELMG